jgi:hypothetical protein
VADDIPLESLPESGGPPLALPNDRQRITVIGKTGSGKTQAAMWLLANRSYHTRPWIVMDFKREELINAIPYRKYLDVDAKIPKEPGLYVVQPKPSQEEAVEDLLWRIWDRERVGLFIDEGYMISARSPGFQAVLTQGRSKSIPVIHLTQRPAWVTRFAFSEADYIQLFQLTDTRDQKIVKQFMPLPIEQPLPQYHSWWWDNSRNVKRVLRPVPDAATILDRFYDRLKQPRRVI